MRPPLPSRLFLTGLLVCLFASSPAGAQRPYASVVIRDVPHVVQKPDFCGEACTEMYLKKLGRNLDQDFVFDQSGLAPVHGRGCYTPELATALQRIGFRTGPVWYEISAADASRQMEAQFRALHGDLVAGVPSIVCMHYDDTPQATEHFRLVLGYDAATDEILYHEPAERNGAYRRMPRQKLFKLWPLKYEPQQWTLIRFRLQPGQLVNGSTSEEHTDADYAQHILQLKQQLESLRRQQIKLKQQRDQEIAAEQEKVKKAAEEQKEYKPKKLKPRIVSEFQIVIEKPFVVIGDESASDVRGYAEGTIRWAVSRLKQDFFSRDPDEILNIWLFQGAVSYEQNVRDLFGTRPHTPFGYYSPRDRALVMDISTGGGTLVHEIVHPFMAANFPDCPSWLNEGMGSLYEQCEDNRGHIWGLTNWRLRGLQEAIKKARAEAKQAETEAARRAAAAAEGERTSAEPQSEPAEPRFALPSFQQLCQTSSYEFYEEDPGTNYAQARYLCYYLQQQGLLVRYFHQFRRNVKDDPSGYRTLQQVLGVPDMAEFQEKWCDFVLGLTFP